ncbi:hypothetical protein SAMN06893096_10173 [Geodermatophilus pulveris]|uniref:Uncharacterized protein n=1 Tax=Geodermatophilus pulveris TaxID=1564159 RepID=A0A239AMD6_9ACTN|nr:hypothetical protein SAMN06893096_10173 [Geodermatophilus pulveris]
MRRARHHLVVVSRFGDELVRTVQDVDPATVIHRDDRSDGLVATGHQERTMPGRGVARWGDDVIVVGSRSRVTPKRSSTAAMIFPE